MHGPKSLFYVTGGTLRGDAPSSVERQADADLYDAVSQGPTPNAQGRLIVFIDEIDAVRSLAFSTDEFFAGIRECYNRRSQDPEFNRLTFCLLGVASPSDLIQDTRMTPFNIGRRIQLHDFTEAEASPLAFGLLNHGDTEARRGQDVKIGGWGDGAGGSQHLN